ncbi:hypothetical protein BU25DRAFT_420219 [Macroventuria anomochaeta]|uniref:Uncharacterized protein n=1 Tax=Macroventuria anomochaeta TaxID=301207 RepID=A0ACB6S7N3_9PLEO|nr:uncharacterized protein BU25DRAFT_420219 [Macroventuria anomochaeta]KAF2629363.1 hypothetical protein BU25DRAFT_420219 [Macroventuria anomochaeta]
MAWHASFFRLFCSHASGRAELIIGLRTQWFAEVDAEDNCSLRVAVWGTACIKAQRGSQPGSTCGFGKRRARPDGNLCGPTQGMFVTEEGLLVVLEDAHIASAPSSMHLPQRGGRPAAATNVMSANSASAPLAVPGRELRR